ncbi:hypothetical protein [Halorussus litoreus]|uniref:hypothetical protein n=1 Tax=Halorussus litoreus TaxID=1710536 RepID=UPI0018E50951|nr:hypothetical protein [Halorussus litoreus]
MERRRFLGSVAAATAVAGCTSGSGSEPETTERDSDGDGVPDSEDYAPNDPAVQEKSDLEGVATTARTTAPATSVRTTAPATTESETATAQTTATTRTTAATTTTTVDPEAANSLTVGEGWSEQESHVTRYSSQEVTAHVVPNGPKVDGSFSGKSTKLLAIAYRYPRGDGVVYGTSDAVTLDGTTELTASVDLSDAELSADDRVHYMAFLMPGDLDFDSVESQDLVFFHETDPFVRHDDGVTVERSPHPKSLADDSGEEYERTAIEGAYQLSFEGSTQGNSWSTSFYIYKTSYVEAVEEPRGRSRPEYVSHAQQEGFADELAGILADEAEANGFSGKRTQVEFIIDFVQNLPYVPDDVSKEFDDYTKFITETITEAGGDCEDTAIMLAAVLQAEPFGYDMVLIQPPGHMAAGIRGNDDLPGVYWEYDDRRYYYIETTGSGWGIGDIPDTYADAEAYVHQV